MADAEVAPNAENAAPSRPIKVGIYCWECKAVRALDGSRPGPERGAMAGYPKCGVDYGPELHSHLTVWPVYALPPDSLGVVDYSVYIDGTGGSDG